MVRITVHTKENDNGTFTGYIQVEGNGSTYQVSTDVESDTEREALFEAGELSENYHFES